MKLSLVSLALVSFLGCSGNKLTAQDEADLATYAAQQNACVVAHAPDKAAIDACRAQVKAAFDARENKKFDGGFGQ